VTKLFLLVSGENPTLPFSEVTSILEAEGFKYRILERLTQALRIEADVNCVQPIKFRAALTKACCLEMLNCKAILDDILDGVRKLDITQFLNVDESFAVRVMRVRGFSRDISCLKLEREIGEIILEKSKRAKVNLREPDKTFFGVLTDGMFLFGLRIANIDHKDLLKRQPRKRVFFHPAAMPAKIARCMVNLAQVRAGDLVLDPFCGAGGLLIEAGLMGCRIIGFDIDRRMVKGSLKNLRFFGIEPEGLGVADTCHPPIRSGGVNRIVTDPPYGTSSSTFGLTTRDLIERFFSAASIILKDDGRICIAAPKTIGVGEIGIKYGFRHLESHFIYVHRRLTREIAVFKRD
jgi:tRNA (guanine10-N2)-dimethyltransferase